MAGHHQSQAAETSSATPTRYYKDSSIEDLSKDVILNFLFSKMKLTICNLLKLNLSELRIEMGGCREELRGILFQMSLLTILSLLFAHLMNPS